MAVQIGIPLPTSTDVAYNEQCWPEYARAVQNAGGSPIRLPLDLSAPDLRHIANGCAGFILPGSPADVDPVIYGQEREERTAAADKAREVCDQLLMEHAVEQGKPVLAICFGLQFLNALLGGTLVQDLAPLPVSHAAGPSVAVAHSVLITGQSLLAGLLTASEAPKEGLFRKLPVNSSHHQAIGIPGDDLTVVARCGQDGVIEAVEGRVGASAVIGVQWHPERSIEISAASRAMFLWLVSEAADGMTSSSPRHGESLG